MTQLMFTGIVETTGKIESVTLLKPGNPNAGVQLAVHAPFLQMNDLKIGDSIAIQGACMTIIRLEGQRFWVDVSQQSLSKTTGLNTQGEVNLEKALQLSSRLGGHLVSGHVDGLGTVTRFEEIGESWHLEILAPLHLACYLVYKGSITVNGVSLTINQVTDTNDGCFIAINLIPHTLEVTTLKYLKINCLVNLEIDQIARYVQRLLSFNTK